MSAWEAPGRSDDWYTPKYIFDALGVQFNLDVAAPWGGPLHVPCGAWLCAEDNALALAPFWHGFVWMNPPFGGRNALAPWLDAFFAHGDGIALTPDRTSAPWFRAAWSRAEAVMFLPKVKFIRPDGTTGDSPGSGTALWFIGPNARLALENAIAVDLGICARPELRVAA